MSEWSAGLSAPSPHSTLQRLLWDQASINLPPSCYKSCGWWTLGRWGRNTRAAVAKTWQENVPASGIMPVAARSGEAMEGLEVLVICWHAAYQAPVGKVGMWPAWAGFEHFPDRAPGRSILIPLSNQGHKNQLLYRPWLILARKWVLEPIPFSFTRICNFLSQEPQTKYMHRVPVEWKGPSWMNLA